MAGEIVAAGAQPTRLTEQQAIFVEAIIDGAEIEAAGVLAGYRSNTATRSALGSVGVQAALLAHRRAELSGPMAQEAKAAIRELITDRRTPAATRFSASKWVLEQAGHKGEGDDGKDVPLHEMTSAQLERFMAKAQAVVDGGGEPPVITVAPDNGA